MFWRIFGKRKIGLVLSGGVARGIAHIGVLKILARHKIPIEYVAATSSGAIVGALYAAGLEVNQIEKIALQISWSRILRIAFFRSGFISTDALRDFIIKHIGDKRFSDLKIPLAVITTNLKTGEPMAIDQGKVAKAVAASSAFPGIFSPEEIFHHSVIDGGIGNNLPVDIVKRMGANYVIAVDVVPGRPIRYLPRDPVQVFGRSIDIALHKLSAQQRKAADILIEPQIEEDIWHLDLHKAEELISHGEEAALEIIDKI